MAAVQDRGQEANRRFEPAVKSMACRRTRTHFHTAPRVKKRTKPLDPVAGRTEYSRGVLLITAPIPNAAKSLKKTA
jgi:hypothetical protein